MKELISLGHVYVAMSPLYRVVKNKKSYYLLDDKELSDFKAKYPTSKLEVGYMKGLGELDPEQLKETTMDVDKRRIKRILMDDEEATAEMFVHLMGSKSVQHRKAFIEQNALKAKVTV